MENRFIRAEEVADELGVSKPYAYKLIRQLNEELKDKGFIFCRRSCTLTSATGPCPRRWGRTCTTTTSMWFISR